METSSVAPAGVFSPDRRKWLVAMAIVALLWAAEVWLVQAATIARTYDASGLWLKAAARFGLDLTMVACCLLVFPRVAIGLFAAAALVVQLGLLTYWQSFNDTLTFSVIASSWQEGAEVADFALGLVPLSAIGGLGLSLVLKAALLRRGGACPFSWRCRSACALACLSLAGGYVFCLSHTKVRLGHIRMNMSSADLAFIYGYSPAWFAEWFYLDNDALLDRALARRRSSTDRLTPVEPAEVLPRHVVAVQVESLGFSILGHAVEGKEVTPFLNRLRETSELYRVRATHYRGSADADFAFLNAVEPSKDVVTYKIQGYPYDRALPRLLARRGYHTVALHGVTGRFFGRRPVFEKMGFAQNMFWEELGGECGLPTRSSIVMDRDLFAYSARLLRAARRPTFHFLITMSSHGPFTYLTPREAEIYPDPQDGRQRYLNSIRYVDRALEEYFRALPRGTLVVLYGDHPCLGPWVAREMPGDTGEAGEHVPCLIHCVGRNLAKAQKTRQLPIARSGELSLVDMAAHFRHSAESSAAIAGAARAAAPLAAAKVRSKTQAAAQTDRGGAAKTGVRHASFIQP